MSSDITLRNSVVPRDFAEAQALARQAAATRFFAADTPEKAMILIATGAELGLLPMQSLRGIYLVQGKPVLAADTMVAVVRRSGLCEVWRTVESTPERCTIETKRVGDPLYRKTWTAEDAKRAKLSERETWRAYPAQMLRHRCAADLAREVYPDVLMGVYGEGELAGESPSPVKVAVTMLDEAPAQPSGDGSKAVEKLQQAELKDLLSEKTKAYLEGVSPENKKKIHAAYSARLASLLAPLDPESLAALPLDMIPEELAKAELLAVQLSRIVEREPGAEG